MTENRFQSKKDQIQNQLNSNQKTEKKVALPKMEKVEKRLPFTFTLKSSTRRKLDRLAKEANYSSTSKFLNDLIENI